MRQTCKVCMTADHFDFGVPDEVWGLVVPSEFRSRVVCLPCFDRFARERGISYASALHHLYFVGDQAIFEFKVAWSKDAGEEAD
jgi:hypothetical protein